MRIDGNQLQLSATDVAKHLACRHVTTLDLLFAQKKIERPYWHDPALDVLEQRGFRHEAAYIEHLKARGYDVSVDDPSQNGSRIARTIHAMKSGAGAIVQADLQNGRFRGRADVLIKVAKPSALGNWSYEVVDTKLARDTRGGTILQLCLYSELIGQIQGVLPERMLVVSPGNNFEPETFRLHDYLAYYRFVKSRLERAVDATETAPTYPEPVEQCEICQWWPICNDRRRADDHLSFVAGIQKLQMGELRARGVATLAALAGLPLPLTFRPDRGSREAYEKVREQARLQFEYRTTGTPVYQLLELGPERGLAKLPAPSNGDVFLDFEADPFVEDGGLEYLLGFVTLNGAGDPEYKGTWAFDRVKERVSFESFIDFIVERLQHYPDLHVYHFSQYEPTALKRLMGRYATREDEMDRLLRAGVLVDLHQVVKQSLRASVERYSLKDLEMFCGFARTTDLRDAKQGLRTLECFLELNEIQAIQQQTLDVVESYNREDCISTLHLRNWLEGIRAKQISEGKDIARPVAQNGEPSEAVDDRRKRALELVQRLLQGVPEDPSQRTPSEQAKWLLAYLLEWHRREDKPAWWEYFRLAGLTDEELLEERSGISGLQFVKRVGGTEQCPIHRYQFPPQDCQVQRNDKLHVGRNEFGKVDKIDNAERTIDVKKRGAMAETHPTAVFVHDVVGTTELAESLYRLGTWVADNGVDASGAYRAGRDLLLRNKPRLTVNAPAKLYTAEIESLAEATRLASQLDHAVLPIQGPPGAGKTYTGARMICALIKQGKKVGITATSYKVIDNLLDEVRKAANKETLKIDCIQKVREKPKLPNLAIRQTTDNDEVIEALQNGEAQLATGTAWLWAREESLECVDVLFVDEAGQMSLADVLAVSQAAKSIVLLGDPQQLEQPLTGTHPPGVASSALQHVLGSDQTMPADRGLFLAETWRLAPSICEFTSEVFYENRLKPHAGLEQQKLTGPTRFAGSGLWFVPVTHEGNQISSDEEVETVANIVQDLLQSGVSWIDMQGKPHPMAKKDILIVSPYNAQVFNLAARLPDLRIGTVDKFQGQEAPVVIYSMATSSPEDAPRGMEFLYSANRFNVATSRARCACILVANTKIFEPDCQTPRRMTLANVFCRYLEMAKTVSDSVLH